MKKLISMLMVATMALFALTACSDNSGSSVSTDGSTSMEKVMGILGEQYQNDTGITVTYNPTGSGSGIKAALDGTCDIGLASRYLTEDEKAEGLTETILAYDGIAIILNSENPVDNLTLEQVKQLYTGKISNWSEVGGNDAEVVLIGREAGSGTRDGFESITDTENQCNYRQELTSTGAVITAVESNPNAIGYASLASVQDSVKIISVNGVTPTEGSIKDGSYSIQRPFVLVTKQDTALSENAQAFFDYITSGEANELISAAGVVPAN